MQHRVGQHVKAVPKLTGESGLRFTGPEKGHTSWLGWKGKPERRDVPAEVPAAGVKGLSGLYSTATDCLAFQQMLMNGGKTAAGAAVLSAESVAAMTGDQLGAVAPGMRLDEKEFNTHANDKKNSPGRVSPAFGVDAPGQGIGLGLNVVVSPVGSKQAAMAGGYSSPACYNGTEWWVPSNRKHRRSCCTFLSFWSAFEWERRDGVSIFEIGERVSAALTSVGIDQVERSGPRPEHLLRHAARSVLRPSRDQTGTGWFSNARPLPID